MPATSSTDNTLITLLNSITLAISRYGIFVLVILGTTGNILNVLIFRQKKLRASPCTLYLCTSSCIDLILTLGINLPRMLTTYDLDYSAKIGMICKIRHFTYYSLSILSVWMVTLAAVDRFLITSPLAKRRQMSSLRNAYRLISASSILVTLVFGNLFYCADVIDNGVITSCSASTTRQCGFYNQIARLVTVLCIPQMVIMVVSINMTRNLRSLKQATVTIASTRSAQYRVRKIDRELIKVRIFNNG
ncbi:unnamed protein product [Adineta ricciae]|uniref:G-protein coupled receptors family 1 profile domain-containing protein n=1 Tax=Adineta ricciae TaxID=249248 RepID=A0A814BTP6_ADIRI|nr:unnamed protein product [Adineta ricciae]CAF1165138.1 unnamed protein product [Adineta ricciae]